MSEQMFDELLRVVLFEPDSDGSAEPRYALALRDPPTECEVEVADWLPRSRPRWAGVPLWARAAGIDNNPVRGLFRGWVRTCHYELLGIVDVELVAHGKGDRLRLRLPCQLIPARALRPVAGEAESGAGEPDDDTGT